MHILLHDALMLTRFLIVLAALLLPGQAMAQSLEGHWALQIGDAKIFIFALDRGDDGTWEGAWTRPAAIESNGVVFRRMSGSETVLPVEARQRGEVVQLTFDGPPEANGRQDVLRFALVGDNQAQLQYVGIPGDPYPLIRVLSDTLLGPFEEMRIYDRDLAVIEAEYNDEPAPVEALVPLEEVVLSEPDEPAGEAEAANDSDADETPPRITADFLDGL